METGKTLKPALLLAFSEGYSFAHLRRDTVAGLTVAIVALPLSMAIAIASGATPAIGLSTAIVGGFFISALSGSRYQIGGPAGAFIVLVSATIAEHGVDGMVLATFLAGFMTAALGLLRFGRFIRFIPYPVTVGFTAGIAVIIVASQIKELFGLTLTRPEPGPILEKLPVLWESLPSTNLTTLSLSFGTIALIVLFKRFAPRLPNLLLAVVIIAAVTAAFNLSSPTIRSVFGDIPAGLLRPALPSLDWARIMAVLPNVIAFTLLGSIEALLSALVADSMSGTRHDSDMELTGQGLANIIVALFGGMIATGTIARTATNIRAGAQSPVSGMLAAVFLLLFMLIAAPLVGYIPLAALAGVLAVVAFNMIEKEAMWALVRSARGEALVLFVTLALTVFRDLTEAIVVGFALGSVLFIYRMSETTRAIESTMPSSDLPADPEILLYRIDGALFFGAAAAIGRVLERAVTNGKGLVLDLSGVPLIDSSGAHVIEGIVHKAKRRGMKVILTGTTHEQRLVLFQAGLKPPLVSYANSAAAGVRKLHKSLCDAQPTVTA